VCDIETYELGGHDSRWATKRNDVAVCAVTLNEFRNGIFIHYCQLQYLLKSVCTFIVCFENAFYNFGQTTVLAQQFSFMIRQET
jgi:hypothetical protein